MTRIRSSWTLVVGAAAIVCVVECGDSTGPDRDALPTYAAGIEGLTAPFTGNRAIQSQRWLAQYFDLYAGVASTGARSRPRVSLVAGALGGLRTPVGLGPRAPMAAFDGIPTGLFGRTFVWDSGLRHYLLDSSVAGAPQDGVRFRLYAVDTLLEEPLAPLQQEGWTDLQDRSTTQNTRVEVTVHSLSQETARYQITRLGGTASAGVNAFGSIESGGGLDLDVDLVVSDAGLAADYLITGSNGFAARLLMNISDVSQTATLTWRLARGADTVAVVLHASAASQGYSGTLTLRGAAVATVSGDLAAPTIVGTGARQLTTGDLEALRALVVGFVTLVAAVDWVFAPGWAAL